jgi:hypothetical protein
MNKPIVFCVTAGSLGNCKSIARPFPSDSTPFEERILPWMRDFRADGTDELMLLPIKWIIELLKSWTNRLPSINPPIEILILLESKLTAKLVISIFGSWRPLII